MDEQWAIMNEGFMVEDFVIMLLGLGSNHAGKYRNNGAKEYF